MKKALSGYLVLTLILPACAPNRAQFMEGAAEQQAKAATEPIGNVQQVRMEAGQGSVLLAKTAAAVENNPPKGQVQSALAFAQDAEEIASALRSIADSRTDAEFTQAVFAMCLPARQAAAFMPRLFGRSLTTCLFQRSHYKLN